MVYTYSCFHLESNPLSIFRLVQVLLVTHQKKSNLKNERVSEKEAAHFPSAVAALKGNLKGMTTTEVFFVLLLGFSKCFFLFLKRISKNHESFPPPKKKYIT